MAVLVATPVAVLMIALSLLGIPVSIVLGMAYGILLYASALVPFVLFLAFGIPFLGPLPRFLTLIFGLGCLAVHLWGLYRRE